MNAHTRLAAPFLGVLCATGVCLSALPAAAQDGSVPTSPQLSIAVDNGRTTTAPGDTLDYTVTVRNLGTADVSALRVTQSAPAGLRFGSADQAGKAGADGVTWDLDLKAGAETVLRTTMTVADTPPELLRMATVACAAKSPTDPPIVCATHSDRLPAGAAAETAAQSAPATAGNDTRWWYAGGGALVLLALGALFTIRRRRSASPEL